MAYYKGVLRRTDKTKAGKYYPTAVTVGRVTTDELCDEIAEISTVSHADVVAVLKSLNRTIGSHLSRGESVQLQGLCNIRLTALSKGSGVDTAEQVNAGQITGYRVVFSAEQKRGAANKGYALNLGNLKWRPLPGSAAEESNNGSGDNNQEPAETANVTITATANDATMGSVTGGGSYVQGASVTLTATANEGYHFVSWSNGRTTASITITAESDTTLTATFAADDTGGTGGDNGMDG